MARLTGVPALYGHWDTRMGLLATSQLSPITAEARQLCGLRHLDQAVSPWIPEACHQEGAGSHLLMGTGRGK